VLVRGPIALIVAVLSGVLSALLPTSAEAARRTMTLRYGPVSMGGFNVEFPKAAVASPGVDGYVVGMSVRLVDGHGRAVTIRDVMLHHVVFFQRHSPRSTPCGGRNEEAFYGTGEENQRLRLPPGYGYRIARGSQWRMHTMLMSHSARTRAVYVQYRVTVVTGAAMTPVRPYWVRASGCRVTYPVWGDGGPGSTHEQTSHWRVPVQGRIVAVGGHLHGGAKDLRLSQPACRGRGLLNTSPRYGLPDHLYYRARPVLHEPGPIETGYFLSHSGIPVRRGEILDITGAYDNSRPHPRVMAIMHLYIAPGAIPRRRCTRLPRDARTLVRHRRVRTEPPAVKVPLNRLGRDGHTRVIRTPPWPARDLRDGATVRLRGFRFHPPHARVRAGATVRWSFDDAAPHNLSFASGPRLIRGPTRSGGRRYTTRFAVPGRYELFCYLHPVTMHEIVDVLPRRSKARPGRPVHHRDR
jgi:hypothetical protein